MTNEYIAYILRETLSRMNDYRITKIQHSRQHVNYWYRYFTKDIISGNRIIYSEENRNKDVRIKYMAS